MPPGVLTISLLASAVEQLVGSNLRMLIKPNTTVKMSVLGEIKSGELFSQYNGTGLAKSLTRNTIQY